MIDYIIVLNKDDDTVSFIDEPTQQVVTVVDVEKNPHEPDGLIFCRVELD